MSCSVCQGYDSHKCPCCGDSVRVTECPDCHGLGITPWRAVNMETKEIIEVTHGEWILMLEEEDALVLPEKPLFCRYDEGGDRCPTCYGEGVIPKDY